MLEEGAFAAAAPPHDDEDLARENFKGDVFEDGGPSVANGEVFDFENGVHILDIKQVEKDRE